MRGGCRQVRKFTRNPIDYGLGFVKRTPDHPTMNEGVTSVVVDLVKLAR